MPRGGKRRGTPGQAYPNRTDMQAAQPVTTVPGQGYGEAGQQAKAQQAAPLAGAGAGTPPARQAPPQAPQGFGRPPPQPLASPTQKPNQPLTAGMDMGPGPGSETLPNAAGQQIDQMGLFLRELYRAQPSEDVHQLLVRHEMSAAPQPQPMQAPTTPPQVGSGPPPQMGPPPAAQVNAGPPAQQAPPPPQDEMSAPAPPG